MTQKEQKQLVRDFFEGKFNVLVATCIAEEVKAPSMRSIQ
jgi:ERCC4-related helicase